eukprot:454359-Prorocentrum_minimum.AAC.3
MSSAIQHTGVASRPNMDQSWVPDRASQCTEPSYNLIVKYFYVKEIVDSLLRTSTWHNSLVCFVQQQPAAANFKARIAT